MWQVIAGLILFFSKALGKMSRGGLERFEVIPPTLHFKNYTNNHKNKLGETNHYHNNNPKDEPAPAPFDEI